MSGEDDWTDVHPTFEECTCDHDAEQHGWGCCDVEGCDCEGGWVE